MSITGEHTAGKKDLVPQGVRGGRTKSDIERVYDWFGQVQARDGIKQLGSWWSSNSREEGQEAEGDWMGVSFSLT